MAWFWQLNLIHLFDFYLAVAFLASTMMRIGQYRDVLRLIRAVPGRWPRLLTLVKQHVSVFLSWSTLLPSALAPLLSVVHMFACRLVWPTATVTPTTLTAFGAAIPVLLVVGVTMLAVDVYATFTVGEFDHQLMQKYFDQAEYWLGSWTAPVVRLVTLGYVNPRQMVAVEVRKALLEASRLLNVTLWWVTAQLEPARGVRPGVVANICMQQLELQALESRLGPLPRGIRLALRPGYPRDRHA